MNILASFFITRMSFFTVLLCLCPIVLNAGIEEADDTIVKSCLDSDCEKLVIGVEIDLNELGLEPEEIVQMEKNMIGARICGSSLKAGGYICATVGGISLVGSVLTAGTGLLLIALREPIGVSLEVSMPMFFGGLFGAVPASIFLTGVGAFIYNCGRNVSEKGCSCKDMCTFPEEV